MYDTVLHFREQAKKNVKLSNWGVEEKAYALCTLHRQENIEYPECLENILKALRTIATDICQVLLPLHPRTLKRIEALGWSKLLNGIIVLQPFGYLEMQRLQMSWDV